MSALLDPGFRLTLRPMTYPGFYERYRAAIRNTWTVEEVDFATDLVDLRDKLSPAERHLVERLVAFFATGDSLVANNLVLSWYRHLNAPEARLYLSGQTVDPALATSGSGAPRGAGRTELAASWIWLATGDERLLQRMNERIDRIHYPQWVGRELPADEVRPMAVDNPDARMLGGKVRYWTPWQDSIAAVGFGAAFRVTGNEHAKELAEELAINVVRHGWLLTDDECIVATALRWQDGRPLTPAEQRDPAAALWSYGTAFDQWSIGAVEIARVAAKARGDEALEQR